MNIPNNEIENQKILDKFQSSFNELTKDITVFFTNKFKPFPVTVVQEEAILKFYFEHKTCFYIALETGLLFDTDKGVHFGIEPLYVKGVDTRLPFTKMNDQFFTLLKVLIALSEDYGTKEEKNEFEVKKAYRCSFEKPLMDFCNYTRKRN